MIRTCNTCQQAKPIDDYAPHKTGPGGRRSRCRPCTADHNRQWRQANLTRCLAVSQAYKDANRGQVRAAARVKYRTDTERHAEKALRWYTANRAHKLAQVARWVDENRDRKRHHVRAYAARKVDAPGFATVEQVAARIAVYGGRCWICRSDATAVDHVKPLSRGGSDWSANLRPICKPCNSSKKDRWPYDPAPRRARLARRT